MEDEPDRIQRVLKFNTDKHIHRWQFIFNKSWATRSDLVLFVDVLEYYLYKKAKGKTDVKLNTRGLYKHIVVSLLDRPEGAEEKYNLPKGGKAWGLAIARLLDPSVGKFIGRWYMKSYRSNIHGRVYYMTRMTEDDLYPLIAGMPNATQGAPSMPAPQPFADDLTTTDQIKQDAAAPVERKDEKVPNMNVARVLLTTGKINFRRFGVEGQYRGERYERLKNALHDMEEELGHEMANQYIIEDTRENRFNKVGKWVESVEEAINNKALRELL